MRDGPNIGVAIVIPCFRHARFLRRAIDSALAQTVAPAEIIVVDDGSPDDVEAVVESWPQVRLIRQQNRGPSAARNAGMAAAASEKIVFLDADDVLLPGAIASGLQAFAGNREAAFVYGAFRKSGWLGSSPHVRPPATRLDLIRSNSIGMIGAVMFDRAKLVRSGGFDEGLRIAEDWDLYLRLSREFPFVAHGQLVACYTRHRRNTTNDVPRMRRGIEVVRLRELERGLAAEEMAAWEEGAAVIAAAYPMLGQRLARHGRRLAGFNGWRARRR